MSDGLQSLFRDSGLHALNPAQTEVVEALSGTSLVIAGAGTGKTHTLVCKVIRTLESGVPPAHILLLTFTNKAAGEMTARVERYLGYPLLELVSGTFHSIAARFLRQYGSFAGIDPGFTIMDTEDARSLLGHARKDLRLEDDKQFPKKNVLYEMLSLMRNLGVDLDTLLLERYPSWMEYRPTLAAVFNRYQALKGDSRALDFDDLLEKFRDCLLQEAVRAALVERFTHVFVDEFQDTNRIQHDIIHLLRTPETHMTVVGDDAQSIYSFRGARLENILEFPNVFSGTRVFKLETNYRSTPPILDYANAVIRGNQRQFPKQLRADRPRSGQKPRVLRFHTEHDQCRAIAAIIRKKIESGTPPSEIAVLYRAHSQSMTLQIALSRESLAFDITSGLRFFEQAHVKDMMAYLRILANPRDTVSWLRILHTLPSVGDKTALKILNTLKAGRREDFAAALHTVTKALPAKAQSAWKDMQSALKDAGSAPAKTPREILEGLMRPSFLYDHIRATYENAEYREDDLDQLLNFATPYENLETFLAEMTLASERHQRGGPARKPVLLTTVHQAKGLEWELVIVIGMVEGRFPSYRSYDNMDQMEEERRLFYVASTRAKTELILTFPSYDEMARTGNLYLKPSRFLVDVDDAQYDYTNYSPESL